MSTSIKQGDQFIKSDLPAENSYGRNNYTGASSTTPGKDVSSGFLPKGGAVPSGDWQTRKVDSTPIASAHGHKGAAAGPKVPQRLRK